MIIDDITHQLPINNYIPVETNKKQIIIGNTFNHDMRHIIGWLKRYCGMYKKTAAYTISKDGIIYNHFNPKFSSKFFKDEVLNKNSIIILLENDGWLTKIAEKNIFITSYGDIYKEHDSVIEVKWRGLNYWSKYTEKQENALVFLVKKLCEDFSIEPTIVEHNTKIDKVIDYKNIMYKSNLDKIYTDVNPSWDCKIFKNKFETNERTN